jgi:hypothetical protein
MMFPQKRWYIFIRCSTCILKSISRSTSCAVQSVPRSLSHSDSLTHHNITLIKLLLNYLCCCSPMVSSEK